MSKLFVVSAALLTLAGVVLVPSACTSSDPAPSLAPSEEREEAVGSVAEALDPIEAGDAAEGGMEGGAEGGMRDGGEAGIVEAGKKDATVVPGVPDPPLGDEPPFDAGVRRDASATQASGSSSSACATTPGTAGSRSGAAGLALALGLALARRRRRA